ncbi:MMPL family transporter [Streptomyces aidingensis]|uniref:Putative drug exporter of the RND superfamily n=1 Tax=Streptomyces aidingensis TaxID=910347 RepID=A0A1I1R5Z4_9ACTN|nr:MMPL family transporter [Streptomyces aidingensis]SFD26973.1 putative drug exporter of the RND superfamily [Streptomyces aidingensis]
MAAKKGIAAAIGGWSAQHRKTAVFGWLLFVVLASMGGSLGTVLSDDVDNGVGESGRAAQILADAGVESPAQELVLLTGTDVTADDAAFRAAVDDVVSAVDGSEHVSAVDSPYDTGTISEDRTAALVGYTMTEGRIDASKDIGPVLDAVEEAVAAHPEVSAELFGEATAQKALDDTFAEDLVFAEYAVVPLAIGILLVAFGALVASVLPVVLALTATAAAYGLLAVSSHAVPTDLNANVVLMLVGLAVGVDYSLFYLRRAREERAAGHDNATALRIAAATSGRAVVVSGLTVIVAMAGMFLTGIATFAAMGVAAIAAVAVAVLGSVTVLPAMLAMLGDKVEKGRLPFLRRERKGGDSRFWRVLIDGVLRRPALSAAVAVGALLALALPVLGMQTAMPSAADDMDPDTPIVQAMQAIDESFPGSATLATVVVDAGDADRGAVAAAVEDFRTEAVATGQLFEPIEVTEHDGGSVLAIEVPMAGEGTDDTSVEALETLRGEVLPATLGAVDGVDTAVSGVTAGSVDFNDRLGDAVVPVLSFVLVLTLVLMLASFRSLTIALTAIVLNLLSAGAAYGVLTLVFQEGVGIGLTGAHTAGPIASWLPLFLFVILFGLSMDYHVFVVSRIREARLRGADTRGAIVHGLRSTASVITAAALIMVAVFLVFATVSATSVKQMGVGLAVAVLLDATIIRAVLLPSVMALLGEANWYLPSWLRWLPDLSEREPDTPDNRPAPGAGTTTAPPPAGTTAQDHHLVSH